MTTTEPKVNPWLKEKLKKLNSPETISLIVEVDKDWATAVSSDLAKLPKLTVGRISWGKFIPIVVPRELIPQILDIPHVVEVHYNMPKTIRQFTLIDPLIGEVRLSKIEVPGSPLDQIFALPFLPITEFFNLSRPGYEFIPTSRIREMIHAPDDNTVTTKVAILDTGAPLPFHPLASRTVTSETVILEPPFDMIGHGVFCLTSAFLGEAKTRFGDVRSVADAQNILSVKCLNTQGFGSTSDVLEAMQLAYEWGARIVSMSLGGPLQGSAIHDDPESKMINETSDKILWILASGNEGKPWSIGSPGVAPQALTVGSYSPKYGDVSIFSSHGPNGEFYKQHPEIWERDLAEAGEDLLKPDVLAPGGGPCKAETKPIDLIYSGSQGWAEGEYDLSPIDGFAGMRGSSMANAIAAGLVTLLVEKKGIRNTTDIKAVMKQHWNGEKDAARGYGLLRYDYF